MRTSPRIVAAALLVVGSFFLTACGSGTVEVTRNLAVQTPGPDAVVTTHESGPLTLSVRRPGVLDRGVVRFEVTVRADAEPLTGVTLIATGDMPTMSHAQELVSVGDGTGRYTFDVPLGMPGDWFIDLALAHPDHPDLPDVRLSITVRAPS